MTMVTNRDSRYITEHPNGYQVRMPKRAGSGRKFFATPGTGNKSFALAMAIAWRTTELLKSGQDLWARAKSGSGVFTVNNGGYLYAVAIWQYENTQVKRMFGFNKYGAEMAYTLAHIARDLGVLAEQDRQEGRACK